MQREWTWHTMTKFAINYLTCNHDEIRNNWVKHPTPQHQQQQKAECRPASCMLSRVKYRKTKIRKKFNKLKLKWLSRLSPRLSALVTYTKRTAEIQAFQRCKALLFQPYPSYLKLAFCKESESTFVVLQPRLK
jgi:hypothetical protein